MKKIVIGIFLLLLTNSYAQSFLYELSDNIDNYKNKNITMKDLYWKLDYYCDKQITYCKRFKNGNID